MTSDFRSAFASLGLQPLAICYDLFSKELLSDLKTPI